MKLLDLFCGAGGATRGYQRAGFEVVGVDIKPQRNYCGDLFIQGDALAYLDILLNNGCRYDAIHASPPCQHYSAAAEIHDTAENHPDLIPPTRERLAASGLPWVMENVERSTINTTLVLCGSMFGLGVRRHRLFESNVAMLAPPCGDHRRWYASVFGGRCVGRQRVTGAGPGKRTQTWDKFDDELATARAAMGIDWMSLDALSEAIPPAYTEHIGRQLIAHLEAAAA
jgi:DNA (cytosine-5)-methyltransferase 1